MEELDEITTLKHKSCAAATVDCLADSGITDWHTAFNSVIDSAVTLGLMPDDPKVIRETLTKYDFFMQSTALEGMQVGQILALLSSNRFSALVFIRVKIYPHCGGYMIAFRLDQTGKAELISELPDSEVRYLDSISLHVWIRWDDGIDRSPYPRKTVTRKNGKSIAQQTMPQESLWYKPYQPNPCQNNIGDCVIRALAGSMNITWEESLRMLAAAEKTTVNAREVFPLILAKQGFVYHEPIVRYGRQLSGVVFCDAMNCQYHKKERIFAYVGRLHVAAVIPIHCSDGVTRYKIADSWDSTARTIGDYWVLPADLLPENKKAPTPLLEDLIIGSIINHKVFGKGTIVSIAGNFLSIDFGKNGVKRLEKSWVAKNCSMDS